MRTIVLLAALVALLPSAAAGVELAAPKHVERAIEPGAQVAFEMPVLFTSAGAAYAKLLPTEGNAVNDGARANGTLDPPSGWRVSFALVRADGSREELGTFVDSTLSKVVPVAADERATLVATVHVPPDAAPDVEHRVYVAIAYRAGDALAGGGSGASMDQARGITLALAASTAKPSPGPTPTPSPDAAAPPVGPIDESRDPALTPTQQGTPAWLGGPAMAVALALGLAALLRCRR